MQPVRIIGKGVVAVGVYIDKAGGQTQAMGVHDVLGITQILAHGGDFSLCDGNIPQKRRFAAAVIDPGVSDDPIIHTKHRPLKKTAPVAGAVL